MRHATRAVIVRISYYVAIIMPDSSVYILQAIDCKSLPHNIFDTKLLGSVKSFKIGSSVRVVRFRHMSAECYMTGQTKM